MSLPLSTLTIRIVVAQWAECASLGQEIMGSILAPASSGWVGVTIMKPVETEVKVSLLCLCVTAGKIVRCQSWDPFTRWLSC